jgi:hypothetical protein
MKFNDCLIPPLPPIVIGLHVHSLAQKLIGFMNIYVSFEQKRILLLLPSILL